MTSPKREKSAKRIALMKARMADPAFKAKAKANLEKGQAALAAKRAAKRTAPSADPPPGKPDPKPPAPPPTEMAERRRRYGLGRWRE